MVSESACIQYSGWQASNPIDKVFSYNKQVVLQVDMGGGGLGVPPSAKTTYRFQWTPG